jgi:hypothetical protein
MAYETTEVPVARSQEHIRKLIMAHQGFGIAFVSDADPQGIELASEGFHAKVLIDGKPYAVRIMAKVKKTPKSLTERQREDFKAQGRTAHLASALLPHEKRIRGCGFRSYGVPRVNASYLVMSSGETIAERLIPQIDAAISHPSRLLTAGI